MKKFVILTVMLLAMASLSYAGCGNCSAKTAQKANIVENVSFASVKTTGEHATIKGTLVCLGCSLKKAEGANAACSVFGHTHALKTEDGKYVSFLQNKFSKDLLNGEKYHNKTVEVHGVYFASANLLDVENFTADGKKKAWCDQCSSMDGCSIK